MTFCNFYLCTYVYNKKITILGRAGVGKKVTVFEVRILVEVIVNTYSKNTQTKYKRNRSS